MHLCTIEIHLILGGFIFKTIMLRRDYRRVYRARILYKKLFETLNRTAKLFPNEFHKHVTDSIAMLSPFVTISHKKHACFIPVREA